MRKRLGIGLFAVGLGVAMDAALAGVPVNLYLGTGGNPFDSGNTFPGATLPFGFVKLSPDTRYAPGLFSFINKLRPDATTGYFYDRTRLSGFSHIRLAGTAIKEGGVLRVLPLAKKISDLVSKAPQKRPMEVPFRHYDEVAKPGYYSLTLPTESVRAELTTSQHCGFHRYTKLDASKSLSLVLHGTSQLAINDLPNPSEMNLDARSGLLRGSFHIQGDFSQDFGGVTYHYYGEVSPDYGDARFWLNHQWLSENELQAKTDGMPKKGDLGSIIEVKPHSKGIEFKLCVSTVSAENAKINFEHEARGRAFEDIRAHAEDEWDQWLNRIKIESTDPNITELFYSNFYHTLMMPTQFTDSNGEYLAFDGITHRADDFTYRTDFSLWDTFRTVHPLYTLIAPDIQRDSLKSLMEMAKIDGSFPRWPTANGETGCMFGSPTNFLFTESYLKNQRDFDSKLALDFMVNDANGTQIKPRHGREPECLKYGYCPIDLVKRYSVSKALEFAWADSTTARLAHEIGEESIGLDFDRRSQFFENHWDASKKFFAPKNSQGKFTSYNPYLNSFFFASIPGVSSFAEGSGFQWRFSVPQNIPRLIELMGGQDSFVHELTRFMEGGVHYGRNAIYPGAHYWHGNEMDLHAIYLFNEAGRPDLTQKWVRWALTTRYANSPDGLDGNDDAGTLSAWYVLSAIGIYPQVGTDLYWIGSPIIDSAKLNLGNGHSLNIEVKNQGPKNFYVKSVSLNGKPFSRRSIRHADLVDAHLVFEMTDRLTQ